jgi:hypothetical protein
VQGSAGPQGEQGPAGPGLAWKDANGAALRIARGPGSDWWQLDSEGHAWVTDLGATFGTKVRLSAPPNVVTYPTSDCTGPAYVLAGIARTAMQLGSAYYAFSDADVPQPAANFGSVLEGDVGTGCWQIVKTSDWVLSHGSSVKNLPDVLCAANGNVHCSCCTSFPCGSTNNQVAQQNVVPYASLVPIQMSVPPVPPVRLEWSL